MSDSLSDEMFTVVKSAGHSTPRLGRLVLPGRQAIDTPHFLANTSRGIVPHITQDTFKRDTDLNGVYVALEDFIERSPKAPVYELPVPVGKSPLRSFTALPQDTLLVLGARRTKPLVSPAANSNTNSSVSICTAVGFQHLSPRDYANASENLGVDIVVALGDIPYGRALGSKRVIKAEDRSIAWLQSHAKLHKTERSRSRSNGASKLFASLLPLPCSKQEALVDCVAGEVSADVSGLALYSLDTLGDIPGYLSDLPRLDFTAPESPHAVLQHVRAGMDIMIVPFTGAATDAGIALDFTFPETVEKPTTGHTADLATLGIDMWNPTHAVDVSSLRKGCTCYACTNHHRAYVQHLLAAKEMLGWVLLQIHNHHIVDRFFAGIRESIARDTFDQDVFAFERAYESDLPDKTGQGPRMRGYQFKSEGPGEAKKNKPAFSELKAVADSHPEIMVETGP
ncbi:unnamed protein product [Zymoseptoria tritici ST99CH_1E4]|uniref:Queuine tRNA-ribosyltransferase accessory subunit 2 n=1 Tax=Zymoseptoria tritici ST99CH_1E4 TaxID=1276532 RepID=A0A2H1GSU8_ZYMTR|nr:unnamed protein product [Zymoseptoria tritici ST99CH_1E4]